MGFVDGVERNGNCFKEFDILVFCERFRGYIQHFGLAGDDIGLDKVNSAFRQGRIQEVGHAVVLAEVTHGVHLILHQGDEGRDYDCRSFAHKGGQLIAKRLAPSGGHDYESVAPAEQAEHDRFLIAFEGVESEVLFQGFDKLGRCCHDEEGRFIRFFPV